MARSANRVHLPTKVLNGGSPRAATWLRSRGGSKFTRLGAILSLALAVGALQPLVAGANTPNAA